jgi:hypothetical protein
LTAAFAFEKTAFTIIIIIVMEAKLPPLMPFHGPFQILSFSSGLAPHIGKTMLSLCEESISKSQKK